MAAFSEVKYSPILQEGLRSFKGVTDRANMAHQFSSNEAIGPICDTK